MTIKLFGREITISRVRDTAALAGLRVRQYEGPKDAEAWNAGDVDVLLAHPASCAYGLNLQRGGHHVIWFGLTWSLEMIHAQDFCDVARGLMHCCELEG